MTPETERRFLEAAVQLGLVSCARAVELLDEPPRPGFGSSIVRALIDDNVLTRAEVRELVREVHARHRNKVAPLLFERRASVVARKFPKKRARPKPLVLLADPEPDEGIVERALRYLQLWSAKPISL